MGTVTAQLVGGPRDGITVSVVPDNAPAEIPDVYSGGHYALTDRVTRRGPDLASDAVEGQPIYAYVPPLDARPPVVGGCRCGCRRSGVS